MNYGGFWIRFLAYLVDSFIVGVGFVGIMLLLGAMGLELAGAEFIYLALGILYFALMHASARQATLGKELCGLKVGGPNGERISVGRSLGREAGKIISTLTLLIGFIIAGLTRNKQALHDFIASTYVVRASQGKMVAALGIAVLALCAPFVAAMVFGTALIDSFTQGLTAGLMGQQQGQPQQPPVAMQAPKPAAPAAPVVPKVANAPVAAAPSAPVAPAAPAPAKPMPVSAQVAQAPEAPKSAPAPVKEPAKAAPPPPPAPVVVKEPAKPKPAVVQEAPREETPAPVAREPAPVREPVAVKEAPLIPRQLAAAPVKESTIRFNDLMTAVIYRDAGAVKELLAFGKWPDKPDSRGMTPLMLSAQLGEPAIAEALLKAGADPRRSGPGGETAISIARARQDAAMLGLLQGK